MTNCPTTNPEQAAGHPLSTSGGRNCRRAKPPKLGTRQRLHDLRHSFVSNQLGAGTPIHVVRDMAAHRSLTVTALYAHSTDEARRAASQRVQIAVLPARRDTNGDTKPKFKTRNRAEPLVPRDGIEPPTRGFSSLRPVWPRPRKTRGGREVEEAAAADLHQIAVLRPRFPRTGRTG
jgi:hypothetical protein